MALNTLPQVCYWNWPMAQHSTLVAKVLALHVLGFHMGASRILAALLAFRFSTCGS